MVAPVKDVPGGNPVSSPIGGSMLHVIGVVPDANNVWE